MLTLCKITDISVRVGKLFIKIVVNTLLDIVLYVQTVFVTYCTYYRKAVLGRMNVCSYTYVKAIFILSRSLSSAAIGLFQNLTTVEIKRTTRIIVQQNSYFIYISWRDRNHKVVRITSQQPN
jgi:hypothetical protein